LCVIDLEKFKHCVKVLNEFVTEATFKVNSAGIVIYEIDSANVELTAITIEPGEFIALTDDTEISNFTINVTDLNKFLNTFKKGNIAFYLNEGELTIKINDTIKHVIKLINREDNKTKIPEFKFNTEAELNFKDVKTIISQASSLGEALAFEYRNNEFYLKVSSNTATTEFRPIVEQVITNNKSIAKYSLEYLKKVFKHSISENVFIRFGSDYPLVVEQTERGFNVRYVLAPRVEN
jgi:DNA polymerase III sliding clamp (beta) subunit (PCNA family)